MHTVRYHVLYFCLFTIFVTGFSSFCLADDNAPKPADVRLLLDVSGSMKKNDPANLRRSSIALLMQLLPEGSKAGVWAFSSNIDPLIPHATVDGSWRKRAINASSKISSNGLFTNIGEALTAASFESSEKYNKSIILLTDGMVDIDKDPAVNTKEWQRIAGPVLDNVNSNGFVIHTIALSDNADKKLMETLSLNTDGLAQVAKTADELLKAFLKTFDAAVPSDQVPITGNTFSVDSSVEEFTALIFKKQTQTNATVLIGPDNARYLATKNSKGISWYEGDNYDLVTVTQPLEGEWRISAKIDDDSRITIVSNLSLRVDELPNNVYLGHEQTLLVTLNEDGSPITRSAFLKLMRVNVVLKAGESFNDLVDVWEQDWPANRAPRAGKFKFELPKMDKTGVYEVHVTLDGRTFKRAFTHRLTVRQAYSAQAQLKENAQPEQHTITVTSYTPTVDTKNTRLSFELSAPNGEKTNHTFDYTADGKWQSTVQPQHKGKYSAQITVNEVNKANQSAVIVLDPIEFVSNVEIKSEPEKPIAPEPETEKSAIPAWALYAIIGLGNIILFGLIFIVMKKFLGKKDDTDDPILDLDEEALSGPEKPEPTEEDDIEPPMENLSADIDASADAQSPSNDIELSEDIDSIDLASGNVDDVATQPLPDEASASVTEVNDNAVLEDPDQDIDTTPETEKENIELENTDQQSSAQAEVSPDTEVDIDAILSEQAGQEPPDDSVYPSDNQPEEDIDDAINDLLNELENDDEDKDDNVK